MASTATRMIAAAGAATLIAGAAIAAAPAAQADGDYYGTWTLIAIKGEGQKQKCEGPAQGTDVCPGGETLTLKSNYRYAASAYLARPCGWVPWGTRRGPSSPPSSLARDSRSLSSTATGMASCRSVAHGRWN